MKLLTSLRGGAERLDMHDVADSSSDNNHFPTIRLAHTYDASQTPVCVIRIACRNGKKEEKNLHYFMMMEYIILLFKYEVFKEITFKDGEPKGMGDLSYTVQRYSVFSIKTAVFNFIKEGINPIQAHCTAHVRTE